jgi:hypothetical protein
VLGWERGCRDDPRPRRGRSPALGAGRRR